MWFQKEMKTQFCCVTFARGMFDSVLGSMHGFWLPVSVYDDDADDDAIREVGTKEKKHI